MSLEISENLGTLPAIDTRSSDMSRSRILGYLRHAPLALCLRELNRLSALETLRRKWGTEQPAPVLDVGCGDGFWWTLHNEGVNPEVYGVDISETEIDQAKKRIRAEVVDISKTVPFPETKFQEIIGNCSLEHVPAIDQALLNLSRTAAPGARLILFVPTPMWAYQGYFQRSLLKNFPRLAMMFSGAINGFFQHWHLYDRAVWTAILKNNRWNVREVHGLGNERSEFLYRLFLPSGFVAFLCKILFRKYPNRLLKWVPDAVLTPFQKLVSWALYEPLVPPDSRKAYEYVLVAEVNSDAN